MHDPVRQAAQRDRGARFERHELGQAAEPRGDPGPVLECESLRFLDAPARRKRQYHLARRRLHAQRIAPRLPMPTHAHEINRAIEVDFDRLRLDWTAVEKGAERHLGGPRAGSSPWSLPRTKPLYSYFEIGCLMPLKVPKE